MTIAEVQRAINARNKAIVEEQKRQASFDYILADLIGRSVSRLYGSGNKMPSIAEAYPTLFSAEAEQEVLQQKKAELSAIRFKQFVESHNKRFKGDSNK